MNTKQTIKKVLSHVKHYYFDGEGRKLSHDNERGALYINNALNTRDPIACLVPNFIFPEKWEGLSVSTLLATFFMEDNNGQPIPILQHALMKAGFWPTTNEPGDWYVYFLSQLQAAHDESESLEEFYWELTELDQVTSGTV